MISMAVFPYGVAIPLVLFTLSPFSTAQVISSTSFSDYYDDGPKSKITCYGTAYDEDMAYLYNEDYDDGPRSPMVEPMAQRCGEWRLGTKCGYRYRPPVLLFNGPFYIYDYVSVQPEAEIWNIQLWAQICNIKCGCTEEYPEDQTLGISPEFQINHINYYEWNFDTSRSVQLNLRRHQRSLNLYGSNSMERGDLDEDYTQINVHSFVGSPSNRPSCETDTRRHGSTAGVPIRGMPYILYMFIHQTLTIDQDFQSPTELCLRELYGSRKGLNLGGICLHPDGQAELTFPKNFRAPEFTNDYHGNLQGAAGEQAIQLFCRSQCGCDGEPELETKKKEAKQMLTKAGKTLDELVNKFGLQERPEKLPEPSGLEDQPKREKTKIHHSNKCSALPCEGSADCGVGCVCRGLSQYVDPRYFKSPMLAFGCATIANGIGAAKVLGGRKLKRGFLTEREILQEEFKVSSENLCACNATYVSASCCWSNNGLVWDVQ